MLAIEVDWYASVETLALPTWRKQRRSSSGRLTTTFSPFDAHLRTFASHGGGPTSTGERIYWPKQVSGEDRTLPSRRQAQSHRHVGALCTSRTNNLFLQDLEKLKKRPKKPRSTAAVAAW